MNRTPFALITLLCTLASSIVAAGNAGRRAGADHINDKSLGDELAMTAFVFTFEGPAEPIDDAGWMSIDLDRVRAGFERQLSLAAKSVAKAHAAQVAAKAKPATFVKRQPTTSVIGSWVGQLPSTQTWIGNFGRIDGYRSVAPIIASVGKLATAQPRVTKSVAVAPRWELPIGSPLRGTEPASWNWQSVRTVSAGKVTALPAYDVGRQATAGTTVTLNRAEGNTAVKASGIFHLQGCWTPSLHVADSGKALLGSYYGAATESKPAIQATKRGDEGRMKSAARKLGAVIEMIPELRSAAINNYVAAVWNWDRSEKALVQSAGRAVVNQK